MAVRDLFDRKDRKEGFLTTIGGVIVVVVTFLVVIVLLLGLERVVVVGLLTLTLLGILLGFL